MTYSAINLYARLSSLEQKQGMSIQRLRPFTRFRFTDPHRLSNGSHASSNFTSEAAGITVRFPILHVSSALRRSANIPSSGRC
jgi:hypothetical protein